MSASKADYQEVFARAFDTPPLQADIKQVCEDFQVEEELPFEPAGDGEHVFLRLQKRDMHSEELIRRVASVASCQQRDIGFCGLKDKRALSTQWLSVYLPRRDEVDWARLNDQSVSLLEQTRHTKKLRRGIHRCNRFTIICRNCRGSEALGEERLAALRDGVPNYFGEQRFGIERRNLDAAEAMFSAARKVRSHHQRGLYLSAARAFIFNAVLAERVLQGNWLQAQPGDVFMLQGSSSVFKNPDDQSSMSARLASGDISITGPLWGAGALLSDAETALLEQSVAERYPLLKTGLERAKLQQQRRALRMIPEQLTWRWLGSESLELSFSLPAGCFATSLLRELLV